MIKQCAAGGQAGLAAGGGRGRRGGGARGDAGEGGEGEGEVGAELVRGVHVLDGAPRYDGFREVLADV